MLQKAIKYQSRMMNAKPIDYKESQLSWEMNVLYWFIKSIKHDNIDIDSLNMLTYFLEKHKLGSIV